MVSIRQPLLLGFAHRRKPNECGCGQCEILGQKIVQNFASDDVCRPRDTFQFAVKRLNLGSVRSRQQRVINDPETTI